MPPLGSPLLQLPHMTSKVSRAIEGPNAKHRFSVQRFMRIPENERRRLTIGPGLMTESQYQVAMGIARQIPFLKVERAFFKVVGERFVTPSSLVQFVVKARVVPPGTTSIPDLSEADLEDVDPEEGDIEALLGRKPSRNKGVKLAAPTSGAAPDEDNAEQPPLAFAPYFARDHSPRWHIFLSDSKQGKMAVPPFTFTSFDKPMFTGEGKPTLAVQTLKMQFQAPPQAGQFTFVMHLVCDSYIGTDTKMEVTMDIEEMGRAEAMVGEDEISEPDEGGSTLRILSPSPAHLPPQKTNSDRENRFVGRPNGVASSRQSVGRHVHQAEVQRKIETRRHRQRRRRYDQPAEEAKGRGSP